MNGTLSVTYTTASKTNQTGGTLLHCTLEAGVWILILRQKKEKEKKLNELERKL